jgi:ribose-phosphate pyrophosphokinase
MRQYLLFSGTGHQELATSISQEAKIRLAPCAIERFPDGEIGVRLLESVRQRSIVLVQPLSPPVNEHLIELLLLADACRRAAAKSIIALIPYVGYARADKRDGRREAIGASVVARLLETVGIDQVITMDLHAPQIEGFFHIPVTCLTAVPTICEALRRRLSKSKEVAVVSPDAGRVHMAAEYANRLGAPVVVLHKRRTSGADTFITHLVGEVTNKSCVIIDDMISTGGTIAEAAKILLKAGACSDITVAATHGVFVQGARQRLSEGIGTIFVTDTVKTSCEDWPQQEIVSVAGLFAAALQRNMANGSLQDLF